MAQLEAISLPRRGHHSGRKYIPAPVYGDFRAKFGNAFPEPQFLESDLGITAVYELRPTQVKRQVLLVHGINTPALGMLPLARELQALDPHAHLVLFDLWGHGLSSTPLVAHTPQVLHSQILQVLAHMKWTNADIVGFSLGGITTATFATYNPRIPSSLALIAPAGLLSKSDLPEDTRKLLDGDGNVREAAQSILGWLGAGPQDLPDNWQEEMRAGRVIAKALKQWELDDHPGNKYSVLSLIRDGGVFDRQDDIQRFAKLPTKKIVIVGKIDDVVHKDQLIALGIDRVEVIDKADHELVRSRAAEIAKIIYGFWETAN